MNRNPNSGAESRGCTAEVQLATTFRNGVDNKSSLIGESTA